MGILGSPIPRAVCGPLQRLELDRVRAVIVRDGGLKCNGRGRRGRCQTHGSDTVQDKNSAARCKIEPMKVSDACL